MDPGDNCDVQYVTFNPKCYHLTMIMGATEFIQRYHVELFVDECIKRERRAVVAIQKADLAHSLSLAEMEDFLSNPDTMAVVTAKRIQEVLRENKEMLIFSKQKDTLKDYISNICPSDSAKPTTQLSLRPGSQLKVRGQELLETDFLEDSPLSGPDLYITLCGFVSLDIIGALKKLNICVSSVIKIEPQEFESDTIWPLPDPDTRSTLIEEPNKIETIWKSFRQNRFNAEKISFAEDTVFVSYKEPDFVKDLYNKSIVTKQAKLIYDDLCYLMYDIEYLTRLYKRYINKLDVYEFPKFDPSLFEIDNDTNDDLSANCVISYLYFLLKEATHRVETSDTLVGKSLYYTTYDEPKSINEEKTLRREKRRRIRERKMARLNRERQIKRIIQTKMLDLNEKFRVCGTDPYEFAHHYTYISYEPELLAFGNEIEMDSFRLGLPDLKHEVSKMINDSIAFHLQTFFNERDRTYATCNRHTMELKHFADHCGVSYNCLKQLLHMIVFNNMKKHCTVSSYEQYSYNSGCSFTGIQLLEASMHKANSNFKFTDISHLTEASTLCIGDYHMNEFSHFEPMSSLTLLQHLVKMMQHPIEMDCRYVALTDTFLLHLLTPKSDVEVSDFQVIVRTPVCMRDFYDFVLDEETEWVDKATQNFARRSNILLNQWYDAEGYTQPKERGGNDVHFMHLDSIKYQQYKKGKAMLKTSINTSKDKNSLSSDDTQYSTIFERKSPKLRKTYDFKAYNLSNLRVQLNVKDTHFHGAHTTIDVKLFEWMYEETRLNINIGLLGNIIYYNNFIGPTYEKTPTNFHLMLSNGIILVFFKKYTSLSAEPDINVKVVFRCKASWPNGLQIEIVERPDNQHIIRQENAELMLNVKKFRGSRPPSHLSESFRCIHKLTSTAEPILPIIEYNQLAKTTFLRNGSLVAFHQDCRFIIYCLNGDTYLSTEPFLNNTYSLEGELVGDYKVILGNGEQYIKLKDRIIKKGKLLYREMRDYMYDEIYVRRGDGTTLLFEGDRLTTTFPDKTRIISYCYTEESLVHINPYTPDEIHKSEESETDIDSDEDITDSDNSVSILSIDSSDQITMMPWVLIGLNCIFEHPRYARVAYEKPCIYEFARAKELNVKVLENGSFKVRFPKILLNIEADHFTVKQASCHCQSETTLYFPSEPTLKVPSVVLKTIDCSAISRFCISGKGKCSWHKARPNIDDHSSLNTVCCTKKIIDEFIVLDRDMEGGRLMPKEEFTKMVLKVKDKKGFFYTDNPSKNYTEKVIDILYPCETRNMWAIDLQPILPHLLQPKILSLTNYLELWRGPYSGPYPSQLKSELSQPIPRMKRMPECLVTRHFNPIQPNSPEVLLSIINDYQELKQEGELLNLQRSDETLGGEAEIVKDSQNEESIYILKKKPLQEEIQQRTSNALCALKKRYVQEYLGLTKKSVECNATFKKPTSEFTARVNAELENNKKLELVFRRALKEKVVPKYHVYMERKENLGELYLDILK